MKLVTNFDFVNAIKDVNEPLGLSKVIRNEKRNIITDMPFWFMFDYLFYRGQIDKIVLVMASQTLILSNYYYFFNRIYGDKYCEAAAKELKKLAITLKELNVNTTYDMLLESELSEVEYKVSFDESKIPFLMQEKYVLVPSYDYSGKVVDTSILQEHTVGSKEYVLTLGKPSKKRKLVRSLA